MADIGPPRRIADERDTLTGMLSYLRDSVVRKVDGVTDDAAREVRVPSGTSLLWLVKHLTMAEVLWFQRTFAGRDLPLPTDTVQTDDTLADAVAAYRAACAEHDRIVADAPLDSPCARPARDEVQLDLRWVFVHMIEETARHAGHADILRELTDGSIGR